MERGVRAAITLALALVLTPGAGSDGGLVGRAPTDASAARQSQPTRRALLDSFARTYFPGRSGQIMVVPERGDVIVRRDSPFYRFQHGSPWDYDTEVPLLLHGAGVRTGTWTEPARHQDIAPTVLSLLGASPPATVRGRALSEAIRPDAEPPRVVAVLVLDGVRRDHLARYQSSLPSMTALREEGAWFSNARIDYLPSLTSVGHATISTGTEGRFHGIAANTPYDHVERVPSRPYPGLSPANLMALTMADVWNLHTDGRASIIVQGTTPRATVGLAGHGACLPNGRPIALAMFDPAIGGWAADARCFRLPHYLGSLQARAAWEAASGRWLGHDVTSPDLLMRSGLFSRVQMDALLTMVERERIASDAVTDLLLVNFKATDYVGHRFGPWSAEMRDTLRRLDVEIGRLLASLRTQAGEGRFTVVITSDHGMPDEPESSGHQRRYTEDLVRILHDRFDRDARELILYYGDPADHQLFVDRMRLRTLGLSLEDLARHLESLPFVFAAFSEDEVRTAQAELAPPD